MITEMAARTYTMRRRAERQEETRDRIVDATVGLHQEVGFAATTIKAVAERAGVERLTVYRHFADEETLLGACSSRFIERNPPPDPARWSGSEDPSDRTRLALSAVYAYYRATSAMWRSVYRELDTIDSLRKVTVGFESWLDMIRDDLTRSWNVSGETRRAVRGVTAHALRFSTWDSLHSQRFSDRKIAELMTLWIAAIAGKKGS
jgi:AcrR family transcriptional regulator